MIAYREFRPSPDLSTHVECYWAMSGTPGADAPIERILPDGCVEVVFHLADRFHAWTEDGRRTPQADAFVVGPSTRFLLIQAAPRVETFGLRFRPAGARLLVEGPLHELAQDTAPLDHLAPAASRGLRDALGEARNDAARVRVVERELRARLARRTRGEDRRAAVRAAVATALEWRGQVRVDTVGRQLGLSPRHVERMFLDEVGLGPKAFFRLVRFQAVFAAVGRNETVDWASLALDCGYADQAHLIRDFKAFSGESPASLLRSQGALSRQFTSPERLQAFFATR